MSEKETYFDGPHLSSASFQPQFNSSIDQRSTSTADVPMYNPAHSSNHFPVSSHNFSSSANNSLKFSSHVGYFPQVNGNEISSEFATTNQYEQPSQFMIPSGASVADEANNDVSSLAAPSSSMQNSQPLPTSSHQMFSGSEADQSVPLSIFPANVGVEPPSNIQPVGTYMNMGYNTEQQDPFQPEHVAIFQPIHPAPSAGVVPNVEENIRSEQSDQPVDHFVSIHPTSFSDLHQDSRTHRNAEDILHSQGTWRSQTHNVSSAEYVSHQQNTSQSFVSVNAHASLQPDVVGGTDEVQSDDVEGISEKMSNLLLSAHQPSIDLSYKNDESNDQSTDTEVEDEEVELEDQPEQNQVDLNQHLEVEQIVGSNLHPEKVSRPPHSSENLQFPEAGENNESSTSVVPDLRQTSVNDQSANFEAPPTEGRFSAMSFKQDDQVEAELVPPPTESNGGSALGDMISHPNLIKQEIESPPTAETFQLQSDNTGDKLQSSTTNYHLTTNRVAVSMHSSYVSVNPHAPLAPDLALDNPQPSNNFPPASELRPNLSESRPVMSQSDGQNIPKTHDLRSQMVIPNKTFEDSVSVEKKAEFPPPLATHNIRHPSPYLKNVTNQSESPPAPSGVSHNLPITESSLPPSVHPGYRITDDGRGQVPNFHPPREDHAPSHPPREDQAPSHPPREDQAPSHPPYDYQAPSHPPREYQAPSHPPHENQSPSHAPHENRVSDSAPNQPQHGAHLLSTSHNPHHALHRSLDHGSGRLEPSRNHSRPHSSMSAHDPHHYRPDMSGWADRGDGYGQYRDDRNAYNRWPHDRRDYDYYAPGYYDSYRYDRRHYDRGYDYYHQHAYYDRGYDRYYDHHRYYDPYSGYYPPAYGRGGYYEEEDRRSVYSEQSLRYPANDTYDPSYQDMSYARGFLDESSINDVQHQFNQQEAHHDQQPQVSARLTPVRFSAPHPVARFGSGGFLLLVNPEPSADRNTSSVQIHSVETLLQKTKEAEKFNKFPGPLSKQNTHKNDVIHFANKQARHSASDTSLIDRRSSSLIWEFLELMVRQNGAVLGTDISELLMRNHSGDFGLLASPNESQELHRPAVDNDDEKDDELNQEPDSDSKRVVSSSVRFRELLLHGRRKDALEWAMKSDLWGHALLLASRTDARTHSNVMLRFANSLAINDPLQTLYQLMSGRQPAAVTLIADEGWGEWRPHLAMILSNHTDNVSHDTKMLLTMGDTLCTRGLIDAAHFCYLMAFTPLGFYTKKSSKLVLIGSSHARDFKRFAVSEAIERTETYEYAIALSSGTQQRAKFAHFPTLQIYKFIYGCRLMELGLTSKAFYYFETIAKLVNSNPAAYSITFVRQLAAFIDRLKPHDSREQAGGLNERDMLWVRVLNANAEKLEIGSILPSSTSCARTTSLSDVTSSVTDTQHPDDDDDDDDVDDVSDVGMSEEEDDGDLDLTSEDHMQPPPQPGMNNFYQGVPSQVNYNASQQAYQVPPPPHHPFNPSQTHQVPHSQTHQAYQHPNPVFHPPSNQVPQPSHVQASVEAPSNSFPPQMPIDSQSQASMPHHRNPMHVSFPPNTQFSSTPNNSIPFSPMQVPPQSEQSSPQGDLYDHLTSQSAESEPRIRSASQTSYSSHRSHVSRRSGSRRSRTVSERSGASSKSRQGERKSSKGWSLFNWFSRGDKPKTHKVHLPDDSQKDIQWDPTLKRWVDANATEEEMAPPEPPPMDSALGGPATNQPAPVADPRSNPGMTRNKFSLKSLNNRSMYKNAFSSSTTPAAAPVMAPSVIPNLPPSNMFVPASMPTTTGSADLPDAAHTGPGPTMNDPVVAQAPGFHVTGNLPPAQSSYNPNSTQPTPQPPVSSVASNYINNAPANEPVAPPVATPFFNPAQFGGAGTSMFSQPQSAAAPRGGRMRRGYPNLMHPRT